MNQGPKWIKGNMVECTAPDAQDCFALPIADQSEQYRIVVVAPTAGACINLVNILEGYLLLVDAYIEHRKGELQ